MRLVDISTGSQRLCQVAHQGMALAGVASPHETIYDAARAMEAMDIGVLPVGQDDRLVGMVTDRDIVVRALARS